MSEQPEIRMIPVDKIRVINPRVRNKKKFDEIVENIQNLGLKRPITVSLRTENKEDDGYDLACGQGRLEAAKKLGWKEIPAIVVSVSREERFLMSLVENIARRNPPSIEMVRHIGVLRERGYTIREIAKKIDMANSIVGGIIRLLNNGEERLLQAVEWGQIPIHIAIMIASANDEDVQKALTEAYEKKKIQGKELIQARKLIERRKLYGKGRGVPRTYGQKTPTAESVVRAYNREAQRQRLMVKKAKLCETQLLFVVSALRQLFEDENFTNLLRAEGLATLPSYLAEQIRR